MKTGGVVKWSRHSIHDRKVLGSNLAGTTSPKTIVNSAAHSSKLGKVDETPWYSLLNITLGEQAAGPHQC